MRAPTASGVVEPLLERTGPAWAGTRRAWPDGNSPLAGSARRQTSALPCTVDGELFARRGAWRCRPADAVRWRSARRRARAEPERAVQEVAIHRSGQGCPSAVTVASTSRRMPCRRCVSSSALSRRSSVMMSRRWGPAVAMEVSSRSCKPGHFFWCLEHATSPAPECSGCAPSDAGLYSRGRGRRVSSDERHPHDCRHPDPRLRGHRGCARLPRGDVRPHLAVGCTGLDDGTVVHAEVRNGDAPIWLHRAVG